MAQLFYTVLYLVIKLRIATVHKTDNGSGWQVVADLHFKNTAINEKLFGKSKQLLKFGKLL